MKDVDEFLYLYIKDHNKKVNPYLLKGEFKLDFNNIQVCKYIMTGMIDNKTFFPWSNYFRGAINKLKEEGYHFNHIAEMNFIKLGHKPVMTYDFYMKDNMSAFEWELNAMINKNKNLNNKVPTRLETSYY